MGATEDIAAKWTAVKDAGLDLGAASGPEADAGFGGRVQVYEDGRIYWHGAIGTFEVHGAILERYLLLGGPGEHPASGRRAFGFPTSDEHATPDGIARASQFEWGSIHWSLGAGAVPLHGPIQADWGADYDHSSVEQGLPLTEPFALPDGSEAAFFSNGLSFTVGPGGPVRRAVYRGPMLGRPAIVTPDARELASFALVGAAAIPPGLPAGIGDARLVLQKVEDPGVLLPLVLGAASGPGPATDGRPSGPVVRDHRGTPTLHAAPTRPHPAADGHDHRTGAAGDAGAVLPVSLAAGAQMQDRTLYSIAVRSPDGTVAAIAPHAVYARGAWTDFGVAHATDIHVSARADALYGQLRKLGRDVSADVFNNPNEVLREFIRYMNHLHRLGQVDVVLATGDLVDYQYEHDHVPANHLGGTFLLFERLIRGLSGSPLGAPVEPLHVPLFTTLGNHDYRIVRYSLYAEIEIPGDNEPLANYDGFNLSRADMNAIQGPSRPHLSIDAASRQVDWDRPGHYFARINSTELDEGSSYLVRLGPDHRIVVLDSKHDVGIPDFADAAAAKKLGWGSEDVKSFLAGSPNQVGVSEAHLSLVSQALREAGDAGVVIAGIHGPPLNITGAEYAPHFRETEHAGADVRDIVGFLRRRAPVSFATVDGRNPSDALLETVARSFHPGWLPKPLAAHFMSGGVGDLLDSEVSKGRADDLLNLCAGVAVDGFAAPRAADVLLCGHGHFRVEYRLEHEAGSGGLRYFLDFFTENPAVYYPTRKSSFRDGKDRINVVVEAGAGPNEKPHVNDHRAGGDEFTLRIPPYAEPLNSAGDRAGWWARHRPLVMQTGALGIRSSGSNDRSDPGKRKPTPNFQGFRVLSISGSAIAAIHYVTIDELRANGFRMPWEGAAGAAGVARDPVAPSGRVE